MRAHLDPSKPLELVIERAGAHVHRADAADIGHRRCAPVRRVRPGRLSAGTDRHPCSRSSHRPETPSSAHRAPRIPSARLDRYAVSCASDAPGGVLAEVARPLGGLLWLPFATSVAVGPLLFAFFAVFPQRDLVHLQGKADAPCRRLIIVGLARLRLARDQPRSGTSYRASALGHAAVRGQPRIRGTGGGVAGHPLAGGRDVQRSAADPVADCGDGSRRDRRNRGAPWLLAKSRSRSLRVGYLHSLRARVPGGAGVLRLSRFFVTVCSTSD